ncbi:MAG: hypothetical protein WED04_01500 [Promethearchaeati archaeon SRVP18_Atabeyarchaeia-1]
MSEVPHVSAPDAGNLTREARIWQRDELLLILKSTGRCLPLEDIAKFIDFLETVLPDDKIIRFSGVHHVSRQLEQMAKSELIEKRGVCYKITEKGSKLADEAELSIEDSEVTNRAWATVRSALASLPSSKLAWDSHLNATTKRIGEESQKSG